MEFLWVILFISLFLEGRSEKIRCYCNLKECLANENFCSSEDGGCFSDFLDYREPTKAKHGCLNLLERERQELCGNAPGSTGAPRSLLLCCQADMCNHLLSPLSLLTNTIIGSLINATENQQTSSGSFENNPTGSPNYRGYNSNEVWFKAATIAVPICGAMILLMLVALAFKILRSDHVNVEKYCADANSNANFPNSHHIVSFKTNELNPKDLSKKIPLLYETRQTEMRNCEDFRSFTSTRIHYGQNVNVLKQAEEINSNRTEKNLENAKINSEKPRNENLIFPTTSGVDSTIVIEEEEEEEEVTAAEDDTNNNVISIEETSNSTLDVRVDEPILPTLTLNLEKNESFNSCNIYHKSPKSAVAQNSSDCGALDKVYDKYLL